MARGTVGGHNLVDYGCYRCTETESRRFGGQPLCRNLQCAPISSRQAVWHQIDTVLDDPQRMAVEQERRFADSKTRIDLHAMDRQVARLRRGIDRLIDSYVDEIIEAEEFKSRQAGLTQRLARPQSDRDVAMAADEAERSLKLAIG